MSCKKLGHTVLAVEMEGAAVAQVCADYQVPFAAMRTISDRADDDAHVDFTRFIRNRGQPLCRAHRATLAAKPQRTGHTMSLTIGCAGAESGSGLRCCESSQ